MLNKTYHKKIIEDKINIIISIIENSNLCYKNKEYIIIFLTAIKTILVEG